jgi:hypothetical protein
MLVVDRIVRSGYGLLLRFTSWGSPIKGIPDPSRPPMGTAVPDMVEAPRLGDRRVSDVTAVLAPRQSAFLRDLVDWIVRWSQTHLAELVVSHSACGGALDPLPRSV